MDATPGDGDIPPTGGPRALIRNLVDHTRRRPDVPGIGALAAASRIWRGTLQAHLTSGCAILALLLSTEAAPARPMHVLASTPAPEASGRPAVRPGRHPGAARHRAVGDSTGFAGG